MLPQGLVSLGERGGAEIAEATTETAVRTSQAVETAGASVPGNSEVQAVVNRGEGVSSSSLERAVISSLGEGGLSQEEIAAATARVYRMMSGSDVANNVTTESSSSAISDPSPKPIWWDSALNCREGREEMINVLSTERLLIGQNGVEIFLLKSFQDALIDYPTAGRLLATANQSGKIALSFSHWIHQGIGELLWGNDHPSMIRENEITLRIFRNALLDEIGPTLTNIVFPNAEEMIREGSPLSSRYVAQVLQKIAFVRYENPVFYAKRMTLVAQLAAKEAKDAAIVAFSQHDNAKCFHKTGQWIHTTLAADAAEDVLLAVVAESYKKDTLSEDSADCIATAATYVVSLRTAAALRLFDQNLYQRGFEWHLNPEQLKQSTMAAEQILDRAAQVNISFPSTTSMNSLSHSDYVSNAEMEKASTALQEVDLARDHLCKNTINTLESRLLCSRVGREFHRDSGEIYTWEKALFLTPAAEELEKMEKEVRAQQGGEWREENSSPHNLAKKHVTKTEKALKEAHDQLVLERVKNRTFYISGGSSIRYYGMETVIEDTDTIAEETQNAVNEALQTIESVNRAIRDYRNGINDDRDRTTLQIITDAAIRVAKEAAVEAKEAALFARSAWSDLLCAGLNDGYEVDICSAPYSYYEDNAAVAIVRALAAQAVAKASLEALRVTMQSFSREGEERIDLERMEQEEALRDALLDDTDYNEDEVTTEATAIYSNTPVIPVAIAAHVTPTIFAHAVVTGSLPPSGNQQENQSRNRNRNRNGRGSQQSNRNTAAIPVAVACAMPAIIPEPIIVEALPQNANQQENQSRNRNRNRNRNRRRSTQGEQQEERS